MTTAFVFALGALTAPVAATASSNVPMTPRTAMAPTRPECLACRADRAPTRSRRSLIAAASLTECERASQADTQGDGTQASHQAGGWSSGQCRRSAEREGGGLKARPTVRLHTGGASPPPITAMHCVHGVCEDLVG